VDPSQYLAVKKRIISCSFVVLHEAIRIFKDILSLERLLKDEEKLKGIASKLVRIAIQNAAEEKLNQKIKNPTVRQIVKTGEVVPEDLVGSVPADLDGKAVKTWEQSWLDLIVWERTWKQSASIMGINPDGRAVVLKDVQFTAEEQRVLKDLNIQM